MNYREVVIEARKKRKKKRFIKRVIIGFILIIALAVAFAVSRNIDNSAAPQSTVLPQITMQPVVTATPTTIPTAAPTEVPVKRRGTAEPIPEAVRRTMAGYSMPANSTVGYDDLSYLTIPHYDFNYNVVEGHLVVSKALANEVLDIFAELFDIKYPIERMELIDKYDADDYTSIDYNNTSAFNYRLSTDGSNRLSRHALGRAIDINPQINPYVNSNGTGAHPNAKEYWSRDRSKWTSEIAKAAYIGPDSEIYKIFVNKYGWEWGGAWSSYRDYQHFQK